MLVPIIEKLSEVPMHAESESVKVASSVSDADLHNNGYSVISWRMDWIPYRLESYYEEYVKRTWYTDKSLYDKTGRRVQYSQNSKHVLKVLKGTVSREKYT
jgi:hypothetical protein